MTYEDLLKETDEDLIIKEKPLQSADGRIKNNRIAIRKDIPTVQKACVLAEELGHYHTTVGNIIDLQDIRNTKQEHQARVWGYNKMIGLMGLVKAFEAHCQNRYETAKFLNVTEDFLQDALNYYTSKHGTYTTLDCYIIYFIPNLAIAKLY